MKFGDYSSNRFLNMICYHLYHSALKSFHPGFIDFTRFTRFPSATL